MQNRCIEVERWACFGSRLRCRSWWRVSRRCTPVSRSPADRATAGRHAARRAPIKAVGELGDVAAAVIVGRVRFGRRSIEAPLSGRRVCYYDASCHHEDYGNPYSNFPSHGPIREKGGVDFLIEDFSGTALIRVDSGASFELTDHALLGRTTPERVCTFLERCGKPSGDLERWSPHESVLEEGTIVSVYGIGEWDPNPTSDCKTRFAGYREAPRRLVMRAPEGLHLYVREVR